MSRRYCGNPQQIGYGLDLRPMEKSVWQPQTTVNKYLSGHHGAWAGTNQPVADLVWKYFGEEIRHWIDVPGAVTQEKA